MPSSECEICGNTTSNRRFTAREMMFGLRDRFDYREYSACGCLQLIAPPDDYSRFYPSNYYSPLRDVQATVRPAARVANKLRAAAFLRAPLGAVDAFVRVRPGRALRRHSCPRRFQSGFTASPVWASRQPPRSVTLDRVRDRRSRGC